MSSSIMVVKKLFILSTNSTYLALLQMCDRVLVSRSQERQTKSCGSSCPFVFLVYNTKI